MKKSHIVWSVAISVAIIAILLFIKQRFNVTQPDPESSIINIHQPTAVVSITPTLTPKLSPTPRPMTGGARIVLEVPFSPQAPYGVWDVLHKETCEEVAVIMAHAWEKRISLTPAFVESEIYKLIEWETNQFGVHEDTTADQTAQMAEVVYGLDTRLMTSPTDKQIKAEIDAGRIVIMGMAGRLLENPHYTPPGPLYHMLVIRGYDETGFIVNDNGTRYGENYRYSYTTLMTAARDWDGANHTLSSGPAVAIVISKD